MSKRDTDTEIWLEDWFLNLSDIEMLFWFYIKDRCDHAGFWRPNFKVFENMTGRRVNQKEFLEKMNTGKERIKVLDNGRWFLTGFISFQYPVINTSNRFHKSVLETFRKNIPGENSTTYDFEVKLTSSRPQLDLNKEQETKNEEEGGPGETEPPKKTAASWKEKCSTFEKYQQWENEEYEKIIHDEAWIEERKEYHRSLDIKMTLKKAHTDFWSTKAGWKNIKSRRGETIDWRATWVNALTMKCNQVWKDKNDCSDEPTYRVLN